MSPRRYSNHGEARGRDRLPLVEIGKVQFTHALEVQCRLAKAGHLGRKIPSLHGAAAVESIGAPNLHYAGDFLMIAVIAGQDVEWVAPAGWIG